MTEEEHEQYHLEVSLEGCGVDGCTFGSALALHFKALNRPDAPKKGYDLGPKRT